MPAAGAAASTAGAAAPTAVSVAGADLPTSGITDSDDASAVGVVCPVSGGPFRTDYAEDGAGRSGAVASTALRPGTADQIIISAALHPSGVAFLPSSVALRRSTASAVATLLRRLVDAA